jgi:hypothetical protein
MWQIRDRSAPSGILIVSGAVIRSCHPCRYFIAAFQVGVIYSEQFYAELFIGLCRLERWIYSCTVQLSLVSFVIWK